MIVRLLSTRFVSHIVLAALSLAATSAVFGATGRTPGVFEVSPIGSATYTIPLWTPPGPNDLQPQLALTYDSSLSNGVLGVGWTLSGLSSIERCLERGVQLEITSDRFCLNGQELRLVPSTGAYGHPNTVYRTEIEGFATITAYGTAGAGPQFFRLQGNDRTLEFGATNDSRVLVGSAGTALRWKLNKVTDRAGNTYVISYHNQDGHAVPASISWAPTAAGSSSYLYTATFTYSTTRSTKDSQSAFVAGYFVTNTRRLEDIAIAHSGTVIRKYALTYDLGPATQRSRLTQVKECADAAETDCFAPTVITYQSGINGVNNGAGTFVNAATSLQTQPFDFNGDNRDDLLYVSNGYWHVSLANTGGFGAGINTTIPSTSFKVLAERFVASASDGILANNGGTWWYYRLAGDTFVGSSMGIPYSTAGSSLAADVDGNGLSDFIFAENVSGTARFTVYSNASAASASVPSFASPQVSLLAVGTSNFVVGNGMRTSRHQDFDGDSRADLLLLTWEIVGARDERERYDYAAPLYSRAGGFELGTRVFVGQDKVFRPFVMHFNDDECSDQLDRWSLVVYVSACANMPSGMVSVYPNVPVDALDWDTDGRDDILVNNGGTIGVLRSTGAGLVALEATTIPVAAGDYFTMDVDGDGLNDLLHQSSAAPYTISYYTKTGSGTVAQGASKADLAVNFVDGFGVAHSVVYTYTTPGLGNYTPGSNTSRPLADTTARLLVVASATHTDGAGSSYAKTYSYVGSREDSDRLRFAGFESLTETDTRSGLRTKRTFRQDFPFTGLVRQVAKLKTNGVAIEQTDIDYERHAYESGDYARYLPYARTTTIVRRDLAADYLIATTTITDTIDVVSGGLTERVTQAVEATSANGAQPYTHTSRIHNTLFTVGSCVGKPETTTQENSNTIPNQSLIRRTTNTQWDATYCRPTQITVEPGDARWQVTTDLFYDSFGNVDRIVETPAPNQGQTARTTLVNWGATGQFPRVVTNAKSQQTNIGWNSSYGVRTSLQLPNGATTQWSPDSFGRIVSETRADNTRTTIALSSCSAGNGFCLGPVDLRYRANVATFDSNDHSTATRTDSFYFDGFDRSRYADVTGLSGTSRTITTYDQFGRVATRTVPHAPGAAITGLTSYFYDALNRIGSVTRPTSESDPTPTEVSVTYAGLTRVVTDFEGKPRTYVEDVLGQVVRTIDAMSSRTEFEYDAFGNLLRTIAAAQSPTLSNTIEFSYSSRGHKLTSSDPDLGAWAYDYFPFGELRWQRDAKSQITRFNYDELSRLTERREGEGASEQLTTFGYDSVANGANGIGQLTSVASAAASESFRYDTIGRVLGQRITIGASSYDYDYAYGVHGQLDTVTYPQTTGSRFAVQYSYTNGYLKQVRQPGSTIFWTADVANARGQVTQATLGNSVVRTKLFDAVTGLPNSIRSGVGGGSALQNESYLFDRVGNLEQRQDGNRFLTEEFVYDDLHRLDFSRLNNAVNLDMSYDVLGNITSRSDVGGGAAWIYDSAKKHAVLSAGPNSYLYDLNGNVTRRNGHEIKWTISNLPYEINGLGKKLTFRYGPTQQRVQQIYQNGSLTETTSYIGALLEKVEIGGVTDWRHSIVAAGETVAIVARKSTGANTTWYMLRDHLGSVARILDGSGADFVSESFAAFGARRDPGSWSGPCPCPDLDKIKSVSRRGFTDHEMIGGQSMGVIHMNGRVQDAVIGRFLSPDPYVSAPFDLQSLNRYSYVLNNPLSYIDPSGHVPCSDPDNCNPGPPPQLPHSFDTSGAWRGWGGRYDVNWGDINPTGGMNRRGSPLAMMARDSTVDGSGYPEAFIARSVQLFRVFADNIYAKAGVGATAYGELKFGFGAAKLEAFSATFGTKSNASLSDRYWYLKFAAPSATLQVMRTKAYVGLGSIEGRAPPNGQQEWITQNPDLAVRQDMTPESAKNIGRVGGALGLKYIELGLELDLGGMVDDLNEYLHH